ncbi:uncharacterized protein V6R79_012651 [Siganus canaliculatus]
MSKIEMLRLLINQRLTAAAEEIFGVFGRTIAEYEEEICRSKLEIDRQRRLLDLSRTPQVCVQLDGSETGLDWSAGLDLDQDQDEDQAEHCHIKQEQEEEQEKWSPPPAPPLTEHSSVSSSLSGVSTDKRDHDHVTSSPSERTRKHRTLEDLEAPQLPGTSLQEEDLAEASDPASGDGSVDLEPLPPASEAVDQYICSACGRAFSQRNHWAKHVQVHRGPQDKDRSFTCDICGKRLTRFDGYQKHLRVHTGEKPYCCSECGRRFSDNSNYKRHVRTHRDQRVQQT